MIGHSRPVLVLVTLLLLSCPVRADDDLCGETFSSPQELELRIKAKPRIKILGSDKTVVSYQEEDTAIIWNFATPDNEAYPSVACRKLVEQDGAFSVVTYIRCGASKTKCDKLAASYNELDRRMRESIERQRR